MWIKFRRLTSLTIVFVPFLVGPFGHQIADSEMLLFNIKNFKTNRKILFFGIMLSKPSNSYHARKLQTEIKFVPKFPFLLLHKIFLKVSVGYSKINMQIQIRPPSLYSKIHSYSSSNLAQKMSFEEEIAEIVDYFGFLPKFVSFICRDSGYDKLISNELAKQRSYRNSDPAIFGSAINFLNQNGYIIIRLGRHNFIASDKSLNVLGINEIRSKNSEKMEFAIAKLSDFFISTGSGPDALGPFFRKPLYFMNSSTVGGPRSRCIRTWLLKKILIKNRGLETFQELDFNSAKRFLFNDRLLSDSVAQGLIKLKTRNEKEILDFTKICLYDFQNHNLSNLSFINY